LSGITSIFCPIDRKNYTCASIATYSTVHAGIMSIAKFQVHPFRVVLNGSLGIGLDFEDNGISEKFVFKMDDELSIGAICITNSQTSSNFALAFYNPADIT
jgi:hypothetical protein